MSTVIYYFSGTGNTLTTGRLLAEKINAKLIPIAALKDKKEIKADADRIGIVFPIYYVQIPPIVKEFAEKLINIKDKYLFSLATYGGGPGNAFKTLDQIFIRQGNQLKGIFGLHMPQNAFLKFWEKNEKILDKSINKIDKIAEMIDKKVTGIFLDNKFLNILLSPFSGGFDKISLKYLSKITGEEISKGIFELINISGKTFSASENCNSCGICKDVCPVNNIVITNGKPQWQSDCQNCLACYNYCPQKAVLNKICQKGYYYHHPAVKAKDIKAQKFI